MTMATEQPTQKMKYSPKKLEELLNKAEKDNDGVLLRQLVRPTGSGEQGDLVYFKTSDGDHHLGIVLANTEGSVTLRDCLTLPDNEIMSERYGSTNIKNVFPDTKYDAAHKIVLNPKEVQGIENLDNANAAGRMLAVYLANAADRGVRSRSPIIDFALNDILKGDAANIAGYVKAVLPEKEYEPLREPVTLNAQHIVRNVNFSTDLGVKDVKEILFMLGRYHTFLKKEMEKPKQGRHTAQDALMEEGKRRGEILDESAEGADDDVMDGILEEVPKDPSQRKIGDLMQQDSYMRAHFKDIEKAYNSIGQDKETRTYPDLNLGADSLYGTDEHRMHQAIYTGCVAQVILRDLMKSAHPDQTDVQRKHFLDAFKIISRTAYAREVEEKLKSKGLEGVQIERRTTLAKTMYDSATADISNKFSSQMEAQIHRLAINMNDRTGDDPVYDAAEELFEMCYDIANGQEFPLQALIARRKTHEDALRCETDDRIAALILGTKDCTTYAVKVGLSESKMKKYVPEHSVEIGW